MSREKAGGGATPEKVWIVLPLLSLVGVLATFVVMYLFWLEP